MKIHNKTTANLFFSNNNFNKNNGNNSQNQDKEQFEKKTNVLNFRDLLINKNNNFNKKAG